MIRVIATRRRGKAHADKSTETRSIYDHASDHLPRCTTPSVDPIGDQQAEVRFGECSLMSTLCRCRVTRSASCSSFAAVLCPLTGAFFLEPDPPPTNHHILDSTGGQLVPFQGSPVVRRGRVASVRPMKASGGCGFRDHTPCPQLGDTVITFVVNP